MEKSQNTEKETDENATNLTATKTTESLGYSSQGLQVSSSGENTTETVTDSRSLLNEHPETRDTPSEQEVLSGSSQQPTDVPVSGTKSANDNQCKVMDVATTEILSSSSQDLCSISPAQQASVVGDEGEEARSKTPESLVSPSELTSSHESPERSLGSEHDQGQKNKPKHVSDKHVMSLKGGTLCSSTGTVMGGQDIVTALFPRVCALIHAFYICSQSSSEDTLSR